MKILPCHQGTEAWHAARAQYYRTASRAPVMMGVGHQSRNELMLEINAGISRDFSTFVQERIIDRGHTVEEVARKIAEGHLRKQHGHPVPLLPLTGLTDDKYLLASFDGVNEDLRVGWECKLWNVDLAACVKAKELTPMYYWQLEQQAIVGSLDYIIFTCSDGTPEKTVHMKYVPVPSRREQLLAGWRQFDADLANYQYVEVLPPVTAAPVMALPALSIQVRGEISLVDNLKVFGEGLQAFIARLPEKPSTDQEFADCKAACKTLQEAQDALDAAEAHALGQIASFDEMKRTKALYFDLARNTRLAVEKMVAAREQAIKVEIVQAGKAAYAAHLDGLNKRLGKPYMPAIPESFAVVIKNKRTIASLHDAVDTELARVKIESSAAADRVELNLIELRERARGYEFLFSDTASLVLKDQSDLINLIKLRITEHKEAEQIRLDAEREKIRAEEQGKAQREAESKAATERKAEQDAADAKTRRDRDETEAEDKRLIAQRADAAELERRERVRLDGLKRAEEALRQEGLDTDQLIAALYERIKSDAKYSKIVKAIDAYLGKQQKAA